MIYLATEQTENYQNDAELAHKQWENALLEGKWFTLDEWKKRFNTYLHATGCYTENKGDDSLRHFILHFDLYRYTKAFLAAERKALENGKSTGLSAGSILHLTGRAFGDVPAKSMDAISRSTLNLPDYVPPHCPHCNSTEINHRIVTEDWTCRICGKKFKNALFCRSAFDSRSDAERQAFTDSEWQARLDAERKAFLEGLKEARDKENAANAEWKPGQKRLYVGKIKVDEHRRVSVHEHAPAPEKIFIGSLSEKDVEEYWKGLVRQGKVKSCARPGCTVPLLIEGKKSGARKRHVCCVADGQKADKRKYWHGPKHSELLAKKRDKRQAEKLPQIVNLSAAI